MGKRLNDTAPIARSTPKGDSSSPECLNVEVRQIDNGFVKRTSTYGSDGSYNCKEEFSSERPSLAPQAEGPAQRGSSLREATKYLK
jgi:hypothetical protein